MLAEQRYKILFIQYVKEHLILTFYTTSEDEEIAGYMDGDDDTGLATGVSFDELGDPVHFQRLRPVSQALVVSSHPHLFGFDPDVEYQATYSPVVDSDV